MFRKKPKDHPHSYENLIKEFKENTAPVDEEPSPFAIVMGRKIMEEEKELEEEERRLEMNDHVDNITEFPTNNFDRS